MFIVNIQNSLYQITKLVKLYLPAASKESEHEHQSQIKPTAVTKDFDPIQVSYINNLFL